MNKTNRHLLALLLAFWAAACLARTVPSVDASSIYGNWIVSRLIPTSGISAGPEDLKPWVGARISYSASEASFGSETVKKLSYKISTVSARDFFVQNRIRLSEIGIHGASVVEIDLVDGHGRDVLVRGPGSFLFFRDANHLVTFWDGGAFEMVRAK